MHQSSTHFVLFILLYSLYFFHLCIICNIFFPPCCPFFSKFFWSKLVISNRPFVVSCQTSLEILFYKIIINKRTRMGEKNWTDLLWLTMIKISLMVVNFLICKPLQIETKHNKTLSDLVSRLTFGLSVWSHHLGY